MTKVTQNRIESISNVSCIKPELKIFYPNAFSPNGDGVNDYFVVKGCFIIDFSIQIFNRWGERLFTSSDLKTSWDGTYKGSACPVDVYYYIIEATAPDGETYNLHGTFTIIK